MPDPPPSPASKLVQAAVAVGFVAVWLAAELWDFFITPQVDVPLWFTTTGLVVLGYVLGIGVAELTDRLKH